MSHQNRRDPLPADYQFPTHGVDCDCPPCRNRVTSPDPRYQTQYILSGPAVRLDWTGHIVKVTNTAYGWGV